MEKLPNRLRKFLRENELKDGEVIDLYNKQIWRVHPALTVRTMPSNNYFIYETMKRINTYGVSRSRDEAGNIVKRELKPYTMCLHTRVGTGYETMQVLIAEEYDLDMNKEQAKQERPKGRGWVWDEEKGEWFRVRKLTPRECFRLMDVDEPDIDKLLNAGISDSQLYKLAGNSIVVAPLAAIFKNLFYPEEDFRTTLF